MPEMTHPYSIQIVGIFYGVFLLVSVGLLVKSKRMKEKYSIIWFLIAIFVLAISLFRGFMDWFSNFIGVYYAPSAFFSILIACSYLLLLSISTSISTLRKQNRALIQELGLLKLRLEELEAKLKGSEEK